MVEVEEIVPVEPKIKTESIEENPLGFFKINHRGEYVDIPPLLNPGESFTVKDSLGNDETWVPEIPSLHTSPTIRACGGCACPIRKDMHGHSTLMVASKQHIYTWCCVACPRSSCGYGVEYVVRSQYRHPKPAVVNIGGRWFYDQSYRSSLDITSETRVLGRCYGSQVYFVLAEGIGRIKIGRSRGMKSRLSSLRTNSPAKLSLLFMFPHMARGWSEKKVHDDLAFCRSHGEWFRYQDVNDWLERNFPEYKYSIFSGLVPDPPGRRRSMR